MKLKAQDLQGTEIEIADQTLCCRMRPAFRGCVIALVVSLLGGAMQAQFWPKKKKSDDSSAAQTNSTANSASTGTPSGTSTLAAWTGPKLRLAVMDLSGSALKTQGMPMAPGMVPGMAPGMAPGVVPPVPNIVPAQPGVVPVPAPMVAAPVSTGTINIPAPADFARGLTEMLTTALTKTNRFVVLERVAMDKVQAEQVLGASGGVAKESAAAQGKILGAQAIVTGDITEFSYSESTVGGNVSLLKGIGAKLDKVNARVAIDIRVIDAVSGQILASQHAQGKASLSNVSATSLQASQPFSIAVAENTPLGQATRQALQNAVDAITQGMQKERWSARVIDFRDGVLYINAGSEIGVQPGFELDVFRPQDALVDPETGQSLGAPDRKTGSAAVQSCQAKYCAAKATAGSDFKRGDVVRMKGDAQHD
jgi:curli biogenesis system outer membrane secretion channel CsgG